MKALEENLFHCLVQLLETANISSWPPPPTSRLGQAILWPVDTCPRSPDCPVPPGPGAGVADFLPSTWAPSPWRSLWDFFPFPLEHLGVSLSWSCYFLVSFFVRLCQRWFLPGHHLCEWVCPFLSPCLNTYIFSSLSCPLPLIFKNWDTICIP